jgi:hypothetical protein
MQDFPDYEELSKVEVHSIDDATRWVAGVLDAGLAELWGEGMAADVNVTAAAIEVTTRTGQRIRLNVELDQGA